jgi:hypothetical protein
MNDVNLFSTARTFVATHGYSDLSLVNLISSPSSDEVAEAVLDDIFTALNQADQRIRSTQESIDVLAAETKRMLSQLKELVGRGTE